MKDILKIIRTDLKQYFSSTATITWYSALGTYFKVEGFHYTVIFRLANYFSKTPILNVIFRIWLKKLSHKYGIIIPIGTQIGEGLTIAHFGGIVINKNSIIGKFCYLRPNVVIGVGKDGRCPVLGDYVKIGAGSAIIGGIKIESFSTIGAGSVVVHDVGEGVTVVGNPAKEIICN